MRIPKPHLPRGRRSWLVAGLVVVGLVLVGYALLAPDGPMTIQQEPDQQTSAAEEREEREELDTPTKGPDQILVPSIGIEAPLVPIEVDTDGVLTPPADTDLVGWWQRSAEPGADKGQTVVTGHTVSSGHGVMNDLGKVDIGELVRIRDEDTLVDYEVTGVFKLSREEVAEAAQMLFSQDQQRGRLVMVSCTDYVDGDYQSNVIVFGDPIEDDADQGSEDDGEPSADAA